MTESDPKPASKETINEMLENLQVEINRYLEREDGPEEIFLYFEDKVQSKGRKQVEDIEKRVTNMRLL